MIKTLAMVFSEIGRLSHVVSYDTFYVTFACVVCVALVGACFVFVVCSGETTIGGPRFGRLLDSQNGSRKVKHFEGFCKKLFLNVIEK